MNSENKCENCLYFFKNTKDKNKNFCWKFGIDRNIEVKPIMTDCFLKYKTNILFRNTKRISRLSQVSCIWESTFRLDV